MSVCKRWKVELLKICTDLFLEDHNGDIYVYYVTIFFRNEGQVFQTMEENVFILRHDTLGTTWNRMPEFSVHGKLLAMPPSRWSECL